MKKSKPEWDEVVEDEVTINHNEAEDILQSWLNKKSFEELCLDWFDFGKTPVRIKCRRGCIQIERVK